jgi:hypothetical protein
MLREISAEAALVLEQDYAQMKLMDLKNEKLRKRVFAREEQKTKKKLVAGRARHMTVEENLDMLAREDWEKSMKDIFKKLAPRLKVQKKTITLFYQNLKKERKAAEQAQKTEECQTKKANTDAEKAAKRGCRCGCRWGQGRGQGQRQSPGQGRGRGRVESLLNESEPKEAEGILELSLSSQESVCESSDNDSQSEGEVIPPRPRARPIRVIRASQRAIDAAKNDNSVTDDEDDIP